MDSLTVNVSDEELAVEIDSWEDGAECALTVRQTSPGQFDLISGELAEAEPEEEAEYAEESGDEEKSGMMKKKIPAAIAVLIGKAK